MESPFVNNSTIILYLEPMLNTYYKSYQNVITLSDIPKGPLSDLVTSMSFPKLSSYQQFGVFSSPTSVPGNCANILLRYPKNTPLGRPSMKNVDSFMTAEDIPSVLSYLELNGYTIEKDMSKILQRANIGIGGVTQSRFSGNRKMICVVSYNKN